MYSIYVTLMIVGCVFSIGQSSSVAANICFFDFEGQEAGDYWRNQTFTSLTAAPGEVINGARSLKLDTISSAADWHEIFTTLTNGVPLQGGDRYRISFKYKVLELGSEDAFFFVFARSKDLIGPNRGYTSWRECPTSPSVHEIKIILPSGVNDYRFMFGVKKNGSIILDDIAIERIPGLDLGADGLVIPSDDYEPYGMCVHFVRPETWGPNGFSEAQVMQHMANLANVGIRWIRVGMGWHRVEPIQGLLDTELLSRLDFVLDTAAANGMKAYLGIGGVPRWASQAPAESDYWAYAPTNMVDWETHVAMMGQRYMDSVAHWEIGNEPDWEFWKSDMPTYVQYLQVAHGKLKEINAGNRVILGGLASDGVHPPELRVGAEEHSLQKMYDAGVQDYFDIMGLHPYPGDSEHSTVAAVDKINTAYDVMVANGDGGKPIWLTEIGMTTWGADPAALADQAFILTNVYTELIKHPRIEKIFWYNYRCQSGFGDWEDNFGVVNSDFTPRPAYTALSNVAKTTTRRGAFTWCTDYGRDGDRDHMPDDWELLYFGSVTNSNGGSGADWDGDGSSDLHEYMAGTNPTNAESVFRVTRVELPTPSTVVIKWSSVTNRTYEIGTSTNLLLDFLPVTNGIAAFPPENVHTATVGQTGSCFYRVIVEPEGQ